MVRAINFIRYIMIFLYELTIANIQVARLVLSPTLRIRPGFLSVPMEAQTDLEVTSLANSITLTPGTISVHVPDDRHAIVIHVLNIGKDEEAIRRSVKTQLESNILRWTRGKSESRQ
ncbi:MAG: Na+/H+ antiporter subunit E [Phycisphaeraceae bacterium]|jgi:multicomponent Na+:H+ antiporter subunit E|nr:Na+/H+ antiporter subunit E [Phycisphaeraceae bacterium]MDP7347358.1 Na+/H+ antiporter subunit E [Phycisphaeraceae bacterium]